MTSEEANRIIAKYMSRVTRDSIHGVFFDEPTSQNIVPYSYNLDSLVPVWEKLKQENKTMCIELRSCAYSKDWDSKIEGLNDIGFSTLSHVAIQEAAAIATAKAIQELG